MNVLNMVSLLDIYCLAVITQIQCIAGLQTVVGLHRSDLRWFNSIKQILEKQKYSIIL